jgi:serine protease AprX
MLGRRGVEWARFPVVVSAGALAFGALVTASPAVASGPPTGTARVIVTARPALTALANTPAVANAASHANPHSAVAAAAAQIDSDLPTVGGVVADVTPGQAEKLRSQGLVVTPDVGVSVASTGTATHPPSAVFPQTTGATQLWSQGINGSGVNVAVLDTGIDPLPDFAGRLVGGIDLSGEGNPLQDSYGHGTFVAGLIAGNGASSNGAYVGEAPGAGLIAVKVAGATGATDLATVIAGITWVVANQSAFHIRVLNLSLGAVPMASTVLDPLDQAAEAAWRAGITVVVSAGNAGPFNGTILAPGDDPLVITAGALDDLGSATATPVMAPFSSVGPTSPDGWLKPDLVTSGRSVVSLRAPGSTIDLTNPQARIGAANFVGSGTSFSAAITSGAAALVLQSHTATPDQVKARLLGTAAPGPVGNPVVDGHGDLNVALAAAQTRLQMVQVAPLIGTPQGTTVNLALPWAPSTWNPVVWQGSHWTGPPPTPHTAPWAPWLPGPSPTAMAALGSSWNGSSWNGSSWNGSSWNGSSWNGSSWNGSSWNGSSWNGSSWNGSSWNGSSWNGSSWNGSSWNGSSWN